MVKGTWFQSRRLRTSGEGLDRRRRCRGRPSLGDLPAMTRVSEPLFEGGGRERRVRTGPERVSRRARKERPPRRRELHRCDADDGPSKGWRPFQRVAGFLARGTGGPRGSRKGVAAPSAMPRAERLAEDSSRRLGARVVPRGSVTRQKLSTCFGASVREDETRRGARTGSPVRAKSVGARRCLGPRRSQETVHAAWRSRPRLSGSTRGRSRDRGPTPVDSA